MNSKYTHQTEQPDLGVCVKKELNHEGIKINAQVIASNQVMHII